MGSSQHLNRFSDCREPIGKDGDWNSEADFCFGSEHPEGGEAGPV